MALRDVLVHFGVTVDQKPLEDAQKNVDGLIRRFNGLWRIAGFALAALGVGKITEAADEYLVLENKLKAVTEGTQEFTQAQKGVEQIADSLAQPVTDVADSFLRYKLATESLGASQEEVLDFTKRVTQAMVLSGATSEEAHRAAVQLSQGFGKNFKAAAQDLKSVKEQAPVLARIIEKAAGGLPGTLLVMAKEGKITSKLVFDSVRAEGAKLDEEWKEHQKTFGEVGNLYGNTFLLLIKRLRPYIVQFIGYLESAAKWFKAWVEDGSAMNTVIAGTITVVTALTYFFGGLAVAVAAAVAPFALLFLALEDFVAFMRGDISITGDLLEKYLGKERTEKFRQELKKLQDAVESFMKAFLDGDESERAKWAEKLAEAYRKAMSAASAAIAEVLAAAVRSALGDKAADLLGVRKPGQSEYEIAMGRRPGATAEEYAKARELEGNAPDPTYAGGLFGGNSPPRPATDPFWDGYVPTPKITDTLPTPWAPVSGNTYQSPYGGGGAPVINNNIVVQGNADAPVAREIGTQAGRSVADILGRDRSAVGAGFGIKP